ncbi:MAG TPA: hypothetical protein VIH91_11150, partial [Terriglobales bacterium]
RQVLAQELKVNEETAQQVGRYKSHSRYGQVLQQGHGAQQLGTSIKHGNYRWLQVEIVNYPSTSALRPRT